MPRSTSLKLCVCALALAFTVSASPESMTLNQSQLQQLAQGEQNDVIVILRDQLSNAPPMRRAMEGRAAAVAAAQTPLLAELQQARGRKIHSFSTINAFATRMTPAEAALLANHPLVSAVVPDRVIRAPRNAHPENGGAPGRTATPVVASAAAASSLCNTLEPQALQLTNTAFANPATPQAQGVLDGNGQPVTGTGVKVAYIADGLDPNIAGFIRPDGSHVFIDYEDFTGDPAGTGTGGGEAFGDASSIAAQDDPRGKLLLFDISKFVVPAHPLPSPCNIHIRGMAPGASLVGLNVFSSLGYTTTSTFVQAIEWAVTHDDVDVINESFGGNPFPDTDNDPVSLADAAAVRAGVTVVVSSGDAGTNGTLGSPSTDLDVISVGATDQWRIYAQTSDGAFPLSNGGIVNNNISSFSSGGFAQTQARTVDVVAPGDSGWALCSTDVTLFGDCFDFNGNPSPIEDFGGTSESSPLTAGEAALVIQAYRSTHRGADPTPALVKQIIMSTATDLGAPSDEQGAGLINSLAAVNAALSVTDQYASPQARGSAVLSSPTSALVTGAPNAQEIRSFTITNTGATTVQLSPALETLGAPFAGATLNLQLIPQNDKSFINSGGNQRFYIEHTFTVPAGAQHLDAAIAFKAPFNTSNPPLVLLALLDPAGNQSAYSIPQGVGTGYGHVDVIHPAAGTWTAVIWTRPAGTFESYSGPVQFTWAAEKYVKFGTVSPAQLSLPPGASQPVVAEFTMPTQPGDLAAAVRFTQPAGGALMGLPEIPVSLRTLIPVGPTGGAFTGTLTGGNGRGVTGPTQTYEFNVPDGVRNMSLVLQIPDSLYLLEGLLVDPQGMQLSVEPNVDPNGNPQFALQMFHYKPQPGRWKFVLLQDFYSSGNQTSLPFTARIGFNTAQIAAPLLPNDPGVKLSASQPAVTIPIRVINSGAVTEAFFADARLSSLVSIKLPKGPDCPKVTTLPGTCAEYVLPTQVSSIQFIAQSSVPIQMDALNDVGYIVGFTGNPDIFAQQVAPGTVVASLTEPEIPYGTWFEVPAQIGPFGPGGAPSKAVSMSAIALTQAFDRGASADSGDIWADLTLGTNTFNPLVLAPGQAGTIHLTITPDPKKAGQTISGFVYVDTFNGVVGTGDEVMRLPYSYTVAK